MIYTWISNNFLEIFGAITGIIYVFLEIRQNIWLWPVGIVTSAVYILVFFTGKLYADMSLQAYYLVISISGWYWWTRKKTRDMKDMAAGIGKSSKESDDAVLQVVRLKWKTGIILSIVFVILFIIMWFILAKFTDSPVPGWDSFITSMSIIATWMLARKIFEHWYLWIIVNFAAALLFAARGLYPTVILYIIYGAMSFAGLSAWKRTIKESNGYKTEL